MADALKQPTYWTDMPAANEYAAMEDYYQGLAKDAGMAPGQGQASGWVGNADLTGLETDPTKTWLDMFQDRIKNTAYRTGNDPKQVERDFWQGKYPLLNVGAPAAAAGAAMLQRDPQQRPAPIGTSPEYEDWWRQLQGNIGGIQRQLLADPNHFCACLMSLTTALAIQRTIARST
jgi:hypothetical protein